MIRLLVTEDEPRWKKILERTLKDYQVDWAENLEEGLEKIKLDYDLVISDWRLPNGTWSEVINKAINKGTKIFIHTTDKNDSALDEFKMKTINVYDKSESVLQIKDLIDKEMSTNLTEGSISQER